MQAVILTLLAYLDALTSFSWIESRGFQKGFHYFISDLQDSRLLLASTTSMAAADREPRMTGQTRLQVSTTVQTSTVEPLVDHGERL
jgi:hypothetical protein